MTRWIVTLSLAEVLTLTSGVFLFGALLLATALLLTCNLLEEVAARPPRAPVKAEA
jgi:hypothetical protein